MWLRHLNLHLWVFSLFFKYIYMMRLQKNFTMGFKMQINSSAKGPAENWRTVLQNFGSDFDKLLFRWLSLGSIFIAETEVLVLCLFECFDQAVVNCLRMNSKGEPPVSLLKVNLYFKIFDIKCQFCLQNANWGNWSETWSPWNKVQHVMG